jgi:hypothetical protein
MELTNHTAFPAMLFRGIIGEDRFIASLAARVTYEMSGEELVVCPEQTWPVSPTPWESAYGVMDGDELFYRGGVDLFLFGHARSFQGRLVDQAEVTVQVGSSFQRRIAVFGDRVWERQGGRLVPGRAKPFRALPLTPRLAFGGKDEWDELEIPFPANPDGSGFYLEEERALGKALPNIEDPDNLIRHWDDRPEPICVVPCALQNPLRVQNGLEVDARGELRRLKPTLFNAAYPRMIVARVLPGDRVGVSGMLETGGLKFFVPKTELVVRLRFDDEVIERPLTIDQIGVEVDKRRVFVSYRYPFRYVFYPLQRRSCELFVRPEAAAAN